MGLLDPLPCAAEVEEGRSLARRVLGTAEQLAVEMAADLVERRVDKSVRQGKRQLGRRRWKSSGTAHLRSARIPSQAQVDRLLRRLNESPRRDGPSLAGLGTEDIPEDAPPSVQE